MDCGRWGRRFILSCLGMFFRSSERSEESLPSANSTGRHARAVSYSGYRGPSPAKTAGFGITEKRKSMKVEKGTVRAPEIGRIWFNSPPLVMRRLRGRVVLVDFWDYTCVNCIRTLPYVKEWHARYAD